jgi:o-succinylbenzoate synthase
LQFANGQATRHRQKKFTMLKADYKKHLLQFIKPAGTSRGLLHHKTSWIISLHDSRHPEICGTGECSLIAGLSPDPQDGYVAMLEQVCARPEEFLSAGSAPLEKFPSIRAGLEMAALDLKQGGKGVLFDSDFTKGTDFIPINGLIWMDSKAGMLSQIKARINEGFTCVKMKIGALDFEEEVDLLRSVRKEFAPETIQLRVDANGAFSPGEAREKLKRLSDFHLHSIEQPIKAGQWEEMAALCDNPPLPIALDEELFATAAGNDKARLLQIIKPQYLVLKPSMLGGFARSQQWIEAAESIGAGWWITSALESNIGLNALAQWTYTLRNPVFHGLGTGRLFKNNLPSRLFIEGGKLKYNPA